MREHVHRLHRHHFVRHIERLEVACLRRRVAAYVDDALRVGAQDSVYHVLVHTGAWWVGDDNVWATVLLDELVVEDVLHVAGVELGVAYVVHLRVDLSVLDSLGHVLDAYHLACLTRHEVGDGARTGIEVVHQFVAGELGEVACYRVEVISLLGVGLVETLRTNLEAQVLHRLEDVVVALEHREVEVAEGVVALLVVDVHERCYLRELVSDVLQQTLGALLVALLVVVELDEYHPLARVRVAYHDVAQQSVLLSEVEERHAGREGIVANGVANLVVQVIHEPAFLDGQNLIEGSGDVETDAVHVVELRAFGNLLACEPALVAASELQFVAVFLDVYRAHDWHELRQFYLSDACELVEHLLLLSLQLLLVGQVLPFASAADAEMLAHWLRAYVALLDEAYYFRLAVAVFLLAYLQVNHVAGHGERHENNHVVDVCQ